MFSDPHNILWPRDALTMLLDWREQILHALRGFASDEKLRDLERAFQVLQEEVDDPTFHMGTM